MLSSDKRRFTVKDGMILVAAAGVAAMFVRHYLWSMVVLQSIIGGRYPPAIWLRWVEGSIPVVGALSTALLICRLLPPRLRRRRLWLLPGTAPGVAVTLGSLQVLFESSCLAVADWLRSRRPGPLPPGRPNYPYFLNHFEIRWNEIGDFVGFAVGTAWLLLILAGRWRTEPSWIDRLGRALGVYWIGLFLVLRWREVIEGL
jgi:hypothetical protein